MWSWKWYVKMTRKVSWELKELFLDPKQTLGTVSNYIWDDQTPAVTIHYSSRREAEKAMSEGRTLGDRLLTLTWAFDSPLPVSSQAAGGVAGGHHVAAHAYSNVAPHSTTPSLSPDDTLVSSLMFFESCFYVQSPMFSFPFIIFFFLVAFISFALSLRRKSQRK